MSLSTPKCRGCETINSYKQKKTAATGKTAILKILIRNFSLWGSVVMHSASSLPENIIKWTRTCDQTKEAGVHSAFYTAFLHLESTNVLRGLLKMMKLKLATEHAYLKSYSSSTSATNCEWCSGDLLCVLLR